MGIEKKNKGVSRLYAKVISNADAVSLGDFMKSHIDLKAKVTTDQWSGYGPLAKDFEHMVQIPSGKKGSNFPELHRVIMMLKGWLRGYTIMYGICRIIWTNIAIGSIAVL